MGVPGSVSTRSSATKPPPGRGAMSTPRSSIWPPERLKVRIPPVPKPGTRLPDGSSSATKVSSVVLVVPEIVVVIEPVIARRPCASLMIRVALSLPDPTGR